MYVLSIFQTELFGCKTAGGAPALSVQVADYPVEVWLPAGILMEEENGREVLVCGGYAREGSGGFQITDKVGITWGRWGEAEYFFSTQSFFLGGGRRGQYAAK